MPSVGNRPFAGTSIFDEDSVVAAVQQPINRGRPNPPVPEQSAPAQRTSRGRKTGQWPLVVRIIISLFICWHLLAVFMAPLSVSVSMATEPGRPDDQLPIEILVAQKPPMQWYLDALYLNHGYSFFAPEPGIGYLIHYDLLDGRGGVVKQGSFPDSKQIWPRLRYHRFLMLASQCEVPAATESEAKRWQQIILACYARELLRENSDCQAARVQRIDHIPLFQREALQNMRPDDPTKFKREAEVVERRQDLELPSPAPSQSGAWNNQLRRDVASGWQGERR
jgi:hypothetical protein